MSRPLAATAALLLMAAAAVADPPAGNWKLALRSERTSFLILLAFQEKGGQWEGKFVDTTAKLADVPTVTDVKKDGDTLRFTFVLGTQKSSFEGVLAKDGKKISGSIAQGGGLELIELMPSALKDLSDTFAVQRELFAQTDDPREVGPLGLDLLAAAGEKKLPADEVRQIADRVAKAAASHGPRWERATALKLAAALAPQAGYADVAVAQARRAERMLTDDDDAGTRMEVLESLAKALTKANKPDEAKTFQTQVTRLESRDYLEYAKTHPPFPVEAFKGRKAKSDRVALVELFSSAEFGPSAGFDLARDALLKAYTPKEVAVLTYHLPLNGTGDPLTAADFEERAKFYLQNIQRARLGIVNGKAVVGAKENTGAAAAKEIFTALKERIDEELEKPAGAKLTLAVSPAEKGGFAVKAAVADLEKPGEQTFLRFAVAEERVRYAGGNGLRYHHMVVRAVPGGKGFPLKAKAGEQAVTVTPAELREKLSKFLDDFAKENGDFPRADRPLNLANLKVIAFVQHDPTGEVLAAAQAELK